MTKNNNITVAQAFDVIMGVGFDSNAVAAKLEELGIDAGVEDFNAKLAKLNENAHKKSNTKRPETPEQKQRKANAAKVLAYMEQNPDELITTNTVMEIADYVTKPQGASSILNLLKQSGKVVKTDTTIKGHTTYKLA